MDFHILYPVKGVVAHQLEVPERHIPAVHGEIVAFCRHMVKLHILAVPERFVMNPSGGVIQADSIDELIIEKDKADPAKTRIIYRRRFSRIGKVYIL